MGYEIIKKTKGMTTYEFVASNGDFWRVARCNENSRGHKANIAYIDHDIDLGFIDRVIKPTLISLPFQGIKYF